MEHAAGAPAWAVALQESGFAFAIRDSLWIYPTANLLHILGLALLVGSILILDLRLLGLARAIPLAPLARFLTPLSILGLCLSLGSGALLFSADAAALAGNPIFQTKMALVALALANALLFRLAWQRNLHDWPSVPPAARAQALISGASWLGVGTLGRLIAYF